jgi:hypothetical protein
MNSLLAGSHDGIWDTNVKVQFEADPFCTSCHIGAIRRKNRGVRKLTKEKKPGAVLHLDVIYNTAEKDLPRARTTDTILRSPTPRPVPISSSEWQAKRLHP